MLVRLSANSAEDPFDGCPFCSVELPSGIDSGSAASGKYWRAHIALHLLEIFASYALPEERDDAGTRESSSVSRSVATRSTIRNEKLELQQDRDGDTPGAPISEAGTMASMFPEVDSNESLTEYGAEWDFLRSSLRDFDDWLDEQREQGPRGLMLLSSTSANDYQLVQVPFIPSVRAKEYIKKNAPELLAELFDASEHYPNKNIIDACSLSFAILLSIGQGRFIAHFVKHEKLCDKHLPFTSRPAEFPRSSDPALAVGLRSTTRNGLFYRISSKSTPDGSSSSIRRESSRSPTET
jgi:hypothetical protein